MSVTLRQAWVAARFLLVMTVVLGVLYPFGVYAVGRIVPGAGRRLVRHRRRTARSSARPSSVSRSTARSTSTRARPRRAPTATTRSSSSGSNLGPNNADLVAAVQERLAAVAEEEGVSPDRCRRTPSPPAAAASTRTSARRTPICRCRGSPASGGLAVAEVQRLVAENTDAPVLGFIGEAGVNVLTLNLALDQLG